MTRPYLQRIAARVRWYEFVPEVVLAVGLGLFAVTEPHAAASAFKSTRALVLMVSVAVVWLAARAATFAGVRWPAARLAIFAVGALTILKVVVLPAYDDHTVTETLPVASTPAAAPATPVKVTTGQLRGVDHRASGTASVYVRGGERQLIGLEDFDIQPGPAYALYLVAGDDRRDLDGSVRLQKLRGNRGTQYYDAPADVDLTSGAWTILVWCETFDVPVANATLTAV